MRGNVIAIFVSAFGFLAILSGVTFATGFGSSISAGFSEPRTPLETYVAGIRLGELRQETFSDEIGSILEDVSDEELVFWLNDEEYYAYPLNKLGFDTDAGNMEETAFDSLPDGLSLSAVMIRRATHREGLKIDIPLDVDNEKVREFLILVKGNIDRDTRDASYDFENNLLLDSIEGVELDIDATIGRIPTHVESVGPVVTSLVIDTTKPRVLTSDLEGIDPTNPVASFTTKYNRWKRNRCRNIGKLAEMYCGVTLNPGEQFSFNEISGPRDRKDGYYPAPEYFMNRVIEGFGGGSCQVSTTLYNSALLAGMQIDERHPHSRVVFYVPRGMDATVNYDSRVDLKFTNVLDHSIVIWPRYDIKEGWLTFDFYGNPDDVQEIEITNGYSTIWRSEDQDEYIIDPELPVGEEVIEDKGTNGIRVKTYRHFIQPDGSKISEDLFYDVIPAMGRIVYHNPSTGMRYEQIRPSEDDPDDENPTEIFF